jgi:protein phosphatase
VPKRARKSAPPEARAWSVQAAALSDRGQVRTTNEDSVYLEPAGSLEARARGILCVVADGMGGYAAGEVASRLAVQGIRNRYYAGASNVIVDALRTAIEQTNVEVWQQAQRQPEMNGMGCTLTAAVVLGDELIIGHVGDSRAYLVRGNRIAQITRDHSWVEEQVEAGALTREQANRHPQRNVILRALGAKPVVAVDLFQEKLEDGDVVVLCSDGLSTLVSDEEIGRTVLDEPAEAAVRQLVGLANQRGSPDNVTAAVLRAQVPRAGRYVRMRRWWPLVIATIVLCAAGVTIVFANREPDPAMQAQATLVPTLESVVVTTFPSPTLGSPTAQETATPVTRQTAHVATGGGNLRTAHDLSSSVIRSLNEGEPVTIIGQASGQIPDGQRNPSWYEVTTSRPNEHGWMYQATLNIDTSTSTPTRPNPRAP